MVAAQFDSALKMLNATSPIVGLKTNPFKQCENYDLSSNICGWTELLRLLEHQRRPKGSLRQTLSGCHRSGSFSFWKGKCFSNSAISIAISFDQEHNYSTHSSGGGRRSAQASW
tara:strand:- start:32528 stop:32869 length:342 start_codon:yes stop_codon:yes gene_type:complete